MKAVNRPGSLYFSAKAISRSQTVRLIFGLLIGSLPLVTASVSHDLVKAGKGRDAFQLWLGVGNALSLCAPQLINAKDRFRSVPKLKHRTYVSTTEPLDPIYRPMIRVASRYAHHFKPTQVTDEAGQLSRAFLLDYQPDGTRRSAEEKGANPDTRPRISFAIPSKRPLPADAVRSRSAIAGIKPKHGPSASPAKGPRVRVAGR